MDSLANPCLTYDLTMGIQDIIFDHWAFGPTLYIHGLLWTPWATLIHPITRLWTFEL